MLGDALEHGAQIRFGIELIELRGAVEIDVIRSDLLDAVTRAVQPTEASVWVKP